MYEELYLDEEKLDKTAHSKNFYLATKSRDKIIKARNTKPC